MLKTFLATVGAGTIGVVALLLLLAAFVPTGEASDVAAAAPAAAATPAGAATPSGAPPVRRIEITNRPAAPSPSTAAAARLASGFEAAVEETGSTRRAPDASSPIEIAPIEIADEIDAPKPRKGGAGCTGYRTYNPETGTYRGYDGRIHSCP